MNVCHINYVDEGGGAANACFRTILALRNEGINCSYVVAVKNFERDFVFNAFENNTNHKFFLAVERFYLKFKEASIKFRFQFSIPKWGIDVSEIEVVQQADIIHLHWPHRSFLSLRGLEALIKLGKPIVWTLYDMWAFTGGCHYTGDCENYLNKCGNCYMLKAPKSSDLSNVWWQKKRNTFVKMNIAFIPSSKWLQEEALSSGMLYDQNVIAIPCPIDTTKFKPQSKDNTQQVFGLQKGRRYILFLAMSADDERKGFKYLKESLQQLKNNYSTTNTELLVVGKASESTLNELPLKTHHLGQLNNWDDIIAAYNVSSVFVIPSLQDNLPNSVLESLACGTPVVGFDAGGIPEMVDHKQNGYVAEFKNSTDLAKGIDWVINNPNYNQLCLNAREKAINSYSEPVVAKQFIQLYKSLLS